MNNKMRLDKRLENDLRRRDRYTWGDVVTVERKNGRRAVWNITTGKVTVWANYKNNPALYTVYKMRWMPFFPL